ncbi:MAG: hypothetical protein GKR98_06600 [Boseongicola sp.]|nr:MAG: hypothetical protein GKR98_06600 [Boseongicola sp.]
MEQDTVAQFFKGSGGAYRFARWGRPIVPIVFGVDDATLEVVKGAIEAVVVLADHKMADHDPELGANFLLFFFRDWDELTEVPNMDQLVPELVSRVERLKAEGTNQYRLFRFDDAGAIQAVFSFVRMDEALADVPAEDLALAQAAQAMLTWSNSAFQGGGPLGRAEDNVILRPDVSAIIQAAYDPVMPAAAKDASHALRLAARMGVAS